MPTAMPSITTPFSAKTSKEVHRLAAPSTPSAPHRTGQADEHRQPAGQERPEGQEQDQQGQREADRLGTAQPVLLRMQQVDEEGALAGQADGDVVPAHGLEVVLQLLRGVLPVAGVAGQQHRAVADPPVGGGRAAQIGGQHRFDAVAGADHPDRLVRRA
jgi:hypothetical protein